MRQVIQNYKNGEITLSEVPEPACKAGGLLVRNVASVISVGTEKLMIEMGQKSLLGKARARPDLVRQAWAKAKKEGFFSVYKEAMNRLDEPIPLGYSAAGIVLEVGEGVQGFKAGDRVAVAGAGFASHAEAVWVPENLCVPIPEGVDFEAAAFCDAGGHCPAWGPGSSLDPGGEGGSHRPGVIGIALRPIFEGPGLPGGGHRPGSEKM